MSVKVWPALLTLALLSTGLTGCFPDVQPETAREVLDAGGGVDTTGPTKCSQVSDCAGLKVGQCEIAVCNTATGECVAEQDKNGTSCDDGDECTTGSTCFQGVCKGGTQQCECKPDDLSNCYKKAIFDKDNKCAATPGCSKAGSEFFKCVEATPKVECDDSDDSPCLKNVCAPATGECSIQPAKDGKPCDDNIQCTQSEECEAGKCVGKSFGSCDCVPGQPVSSACWGADYDVFGVAQTTKKSTQKCTGKVVCELQSLSPGVLDYACILDTKTIVVCDDDGQPCTVAECDPSDGACKQKPRAKGTLCDDGDACTSAGSCDGDGKCDGQTALCACANDADCAAKEDGDLCNGTLYCDKAAKTCKVAPLSLVTCASAGDTECLRNICISSTGKCEMVPTELIKQTKLNDGSLKTSVLTKAQGYVPCEDGSTCTVNDGCANGTCVSGTVVCGCQSNVDCKSKDSTDQCKGTHYCDKLSGQCKLNPASVQVCLDNDGDPCTVVKCDPKDGQCKVAPLGVEKVICEDGDSCTVGDVCDSKTGKCTPGTVICPCQSDAECAAKEDGDFCNGTLYCDLTDNQCKVNPATIKTCPSVFDTDCLKNQCNPLSGTCSMQPANEYLSCKADTPCAQSPFCQAGQCTWDTNLCQCKAAADCAHLTDGNLCLGTPACDKGLCILTGAPPPCAQDPSRPCESNVCQKDSGTCKFVPVSDNTPCDDGDSCSVTDTCQAGKCAAGVNVCACAADTDCAKFDDPSTLCDDYKCVAQGNAKVCTNTPVTCLNSGTDCKLNLCDAKTGKCSLATAGKCDDGNSCTVDTCGADGKCSYAVPNGGVDGEPCTSSKTGVGLCDDKAQCVPAPVPGLMLIPGGDTQMGCNVAADLNCPQEENPQHLTKVNTFWIQRLEVQVSEYNACVQAGKCTSPKSGGKCSFGQQADLPINCVDWLQAKAYCAFLHPKGRLATEAEWERAARGGCDLYGVDAAACTTKMPTYVWGNTPKPSCAQMILDEYTSDSVKGCQLNGPNPVGARAKGDLSPYGVIDMAGNLREWVADYYATDWYQKSGASAANTTGPASGTTRVVRGGAWDLGAADARAARRLGLDPTKPYENVGIRCVVPAQ